MRHPRLALACTLALVGCPADDEGDQPPPECAAAGDAVAEFSVRFPDAPELDAAHHLVVQCTVTDLTTPGTNVVTELICLIVDTPDSIAVEITIPASPAGPVGWGVDDMVFLRTLREGDAALGEEVRYLNLASQQGTLIVGVDANDPDLDWYAPFGVTESSPCGEEGLDARPDLPLQLEFSRDGVGVAIVSGHRGTIVLGDRTYAIDVGEATSDHRSSYVFHHHEVLFRNVQQ